MPFSCAAPIHRECVRRFPTIEKGPILLDAQRRRLEWQVRRLSDALFRERANPNHIQHWNSFDDISPAPAFANSRQHEPTLCGTCGAWWERANPNHTCTGMHSTRSRLPPAFANSRRHKMGSCCFHETFASGAGVSRRRYSASVSLLNRSQPNGMPFSCRERAENTTKKGAILRAKRSAGTAG